jgi:hypothetical protein
MQKLVVILVGLLVSAVAIEFVSAVKNNQLVQILSTTEGVEVSASYAFCGEQAAAITFCDSVMVFKFSCLNNTTSSNACIHPNFDICGGRFSNRKVLTTELLNGGKSARAVRENDSKIAVLQTGMKLSMMPGELIFPSATNQNVAGLFKVPVLGTNISRTILGFDESGTISKIISPKNAFLLKVSQRQFGSQKKNSYV